MAAAPIPRTARFPRMILVVCDSGELSVQQALRESVEAASAARRERIAVVGGGPAGLTAAYYLALMGHEVDVYEKRRQLGGMLRYGIPSYRFPRELLDREIDSIRRRGRGCPCG